MPAGPEQQVVLTDGLACVGGPDRVGRYAQLECLDDGPAVRAAWFRHRPHKTPAGVGGPDPIADRPGLPVGDDPRRSGGELAGQVPAAMPVVFAA